MKYQSLSNPHSSFKRDRFLCTQHYLYPMVQNDGYGLIFLRFQFSFTHTKTPNNRMNVSQQTVETNPS